MKPYFRFYKPSLRFCFLNRQRPLWVAREITPVLTSVGCFYSSNTCLTVRTWCKMKLRLLELLLAMLMFVSALD